MASDKAQKIERTSKWPLSSITISQENKIQKKKSFSKTHSEKRKTCFVQFHSFFNEVSFSESLSSVRFVNRNSGGKNL